MASISVVLPLLHLVINRLGQRITQFVHGAGDDALQAAGLGDAGVGHLLIQLGADEIVVIPKRRVALFGAPLIVAEHHHGDGGPLLAADGGEFRHRDAEGAITREADDRHIGAADLGADD